MTSEEGGIGLPELVYRPKHFWLNVRDFVAFAHCPLSLLHDYRYSDKEEAAPGEKAAPKRVVPAERGEERHFRFTTKVQAKEPEIIEGIRYELGCCIQRELDGDGHQEHQMRDMEYFLGRIKKEKMRFMAHEKIESEQLEIAGRPDISIIIENETFPRTFPNIVKLPLDFKTGKYPPDDADFSDFKLGDPFYPHKLQEGLYLLINPLWYDKRMRFGFLLYDDKTEGHRAMMVILDDELVDDIKAIAPHVRKIRSKHNPVDEKWIIDKYSGLMPDRDKLCESCYYTRACLYFNSATAKKPKYIV
jgi:hypothetical protein